MLISFLALSAVVPLVAGWWTTHQASSRRMDRMVADHRALVAELLA